MLNWFLKELSNGLFNLLMAIYNYDGKYFICCNYFCRDCSCGTEQANRIEVIGFFRKFVKF